MLLPLGRGGRFPLSVLTNIADSTLLQRPLTSVCPQGQAIRAISQMGAVTCQPTEASVAPPLSLIAGAGVPLLDIKNNGTGGAIVGESSSPFASGYFRALGTSDGAALRADTTSGSQGDAMSAYNYGTDGYGLLAELVNPNNPKAAIFARTAGGGQAIRAEINNDSGADAVYARSTSTDPTSYAGFFSGNVNVTGNLSVDGMISKGGGTFRIDHPLAPATRYLQHSFVESDDMKNIYDGVVRTDGRGYATVRLPRWFQALNEDFRYQLTTIRSFARAIVWREVSAQPLRDPHRPAAREGVLAGDRHPARRLRARPPREGRRGQAALTGRPVPSRRGVTILGNGLGEAPDRRCGRRGADGAGHALALLPLERAARRGARAHRAGGRARQAIGARPARRPRPRARRVPRRARPASRWPRRCVEAAAGDPELDEGEVLQLREDLARELARLADADIKASRSAPEPGTPHG